MFAATPDTPQSTAGGDTEASFAGSSPGRVTLRRLNKTEYGNSIRDLFGITPNPGAELTPDAIGEGFDNNADALQTTPADLDVLQRGAAQIGQAVGDANSAAFAKVVAGCSLSEPGADACLKSSVAALAFRAWRRPVADEEVAGLVGTLAADVAPAERLGAAASAIVLSPFFMYKVELDGPGAAGEARPLDSFEVATRLSYFLWSSTPDDSLLAAAKGGMLATDAGLRAQLNRMLADPKSQALIDDFVGQWFWLRTAAKAAPDAAAFPAFSEGLRADMLAETRAFFADLIARNAPVADTLIATTSFLNDDLAAFYGIAKPGSSQLAKAPLGNHRLGALTQGSLLLATSPPTRESPVMRGKFILTQLLCTAPQPPPPGIAPLAESGEAPVTDRDVLERHVRDPACASCHDVIDPLGYAMMHFDGIGRWRDSDHGMPINTAGTWPDGRPIADAADLAAQLAADERYTACTTRQLFTYALGRAYRDEDSLSLGQLVAQSPKNVGFRDLIEGIVLSPSFRARQRSD